jgi:hypothetical protein
MAVDVQWTDLDPETGEKRFVRAEKFARAWSFAVRHRRRESWAPPARVTREMWETLLDALERRYRRREGISEADVEAVRRTLAAYREPPTIEPVDLPD